MRDVKHGAMIDFRIFGESPTELLRIPGVQVRVKVEDGDTSPG